MTTGYAPTAAYSSPLADTALLAGRILLVVMFVLSGFGKFMDLGGTADYIASKSLPMPYLLGIAAGATELAGGLLIVIGWQTRLAALALMLFTLIAAYIFHDFWHLPAGAEQMNTMIHAMKNVSSAGGLLMLAGSGAGRYSVDGRSV